MNRLLTFLFVIQSSVIIGQSILFNSTPAYKWILDTLKVDTTYSRSKNFEIRIWNEPASMNVYQLLQVVHDSSNSWHAFFYNFKYRKGINDFYERGFAVAFIDSIWISKRKELKVNNWDKTWNDLQDNNILLAGNIEELDSLSRRFHCRVLDGTKFVFEFYFTDKYVIYTIDNPYSRAYCEFEGNNAILWSISRNLQLLTKGLGIKWIL